MDNKYLSYNKEQMSQMITNLISYLEHQISVHKDLSIENNDLFHFMHSPSLLHKLNEKYNLYIIVENNNMKNNFSKVKNIKILSKNSLHNKLNKKENGKKILFLWIGLRERNCDLLLSYNKIKEEVHNLFINDVVYSNFIPNKGRKVKDLEAPNLKDLKEVEFLNNCN